LTYIDLKSDLYLFKAMYRFTRDSYMRRQKRSVTKSKSW